MFDQDSTVTPRSLSTNLRPQRDAHYITEVLSECGEVAGTVWRAARTTGTDNSSMNVSLHGLSDNQHQGRRIAPRRSKPVFATVSRSTRASSGVKAAMSLFFARLTKHHRGNATYDFHASFDAVDSMAEFCHLGLKRSKKDSINRLHAYWTWGSQLGDIPGLSIVLLGNNFFVTIGSRGQFILQSFGIHRQLHTRTLTETVTLVLLDAGGSTTIGTAGAIYQGANLPPWPPPKRSALNTVAAGHGGTTTTDLVGRCHVAFVNFTQTGFSRGSLSFPDSRLNMQNLAAGQLLFIEQLLEPREKSSEGQNVGALASELWGCIRNSWANDTCKAYIWSPRLSMRARTKGSIVERQGPWREVDDLDTYRAPGRTLPLCSPQNQRLPLNHRRARKSFVAGETGVHLQLQDLQTGLWEFAQMGGTMGGRHVCREKNGSSSRRTDNSEYEDIWRVVFVYGCQDGDR
ncbi:hypothetical protein BC835DRAFT_1306204 [Cytidiella melzeri]|nr:hypothetical protein BC835DRAFT_1306204 [Cytidiella melzeri]